MAEELQHGEAQPVGRQDGVVAVLPQHGEGRPLGTQQGEEREREEEELVIMKETNVETRYHIIFLM